MLESYGINVALGTTGKGGFAAIRQLIGVLGTGDHVCLTPDAPPTPAMTVSRGIATLSRLSGAPIIPMGYSARRAIVLDNWDRQVVPLPFSTHVVLCGDPMPAPTSKDAELSLVSELEETLLQIQDDADAIVSREPVRSRDPNRHQRKAASP